MPRVPAYCPSCGGIFPAPLTLGPGVRVALGGDVKTECPFCGSFVALEGEFEGAEDAIRIIRSKYITPEALKAFAGVLREAYERRFSIEETKRRASAIDPALGEAVEKIGTSGNVWRASLLVLMFALSRCNFDTKVSLDVNDLLRQIMSQAPAVTTQLVPLPKPDPRPNKGIE